MTVSVTFGGVEVQNVTVTSDTAMKIMTPAGTGKVKIVLSTAGGVADQQLDFEYKASDTLNLTSIDPTGSVQAGGDTATLTGEGFKAGMGVSFGSAGDADDVKIVNYTTITCTIPAYSAAQGETVEVTVTSSGAPSNAVDFSYYDR